MPYHSVLFGIHWGPLNCAWAWHSLPILFPCVFPDAYWHRGKAGRAMISRPKIKVSLPTCQLTDRPTLQGRMEKLQSHFSSSLLSTAGIHHQKKEGAHASDRWKLLNFNHYWGEWGREGEPNERGRPVRWHHAPTVPTSHTLQLTACRLRVSVRKAAIISGNKHFNTCICPQSTAPHKWESYWAWTC